MSIRHVTELVCDDCDCVIRVWIDGIGLLSAEFSALSQAARSGWLDCDGSDICPDCLLVREMRQAETSC